MNTWLNCARALSDDVIPVYVDYNESAQRFGDGLIDAIYFTTQFPNASILEIESKRKIRLVEIGSEKIKELIDKYSFYVPATIPTGIYKCLTEPYQTVALPALWICEAKLSNDLVYKMTKTLWEHRDDLEKVYYQQFKNVTLKTAINGMGIPLHPGAELYYKEVGLIK